MAGISKQNWTEKGLEIVATEGALALTIEQLCTRMGLTKGSFYHHFANMDDYKDALLAYYENAGTRQIITLTEEAGAPQVKLQTLLGLTLTGLEGLEVGIRAWALQDRRAQEYQERIDTVRMAYLQQLAAATLGDSDQALIVARLIYTIYIGSQHIRPPLTGEALRLLYSQILDLYGLMP